MLNFHWSRADNPGIVHTITSALARAGKIKAAIVEWGDSVGIYLIRYIHLYI
jgi:hypothetical protein